MASRRQLILEAIRTRLEAIQIDDGFQTNAGSQLFMGEAPTLGEDDPDVAIAIVVGDDNPSYQGEQTMLAMPVMVQAIAKADLDDPYVAAEAVLADIKKAVELADRTLDGLVRRQIQRGATRTLPREPGSTTVGIGITYVAPYTELWGTP